MNNSNGAPLRWLFQLFRSLFFRGLKLFGLSSFNTASNSQIRKLDAEFDEYPPCEMCSSIAVSELFIADDGSRIVKCDECDLCFTSPRIAEIAWMDYLRQPSDRSVELTENRLQYGVALPSNVKYVPPFWRSRQDKLLNSILDSISKYSSDEVKRLHDVGCGVGFLLQAASERGIHTTGNELNGYACQVMNERLGLTVYNDILPDLQMTPESLDAVVMRDYIEHTYHPFADLTTAHKLLKPAGILYVETFHIDCEAFDKLGKSWNMLFWNHVFHFSTKTLTDMIIKSGFDILHVDSPYDKSLIKVFAQKR